MVWPIIFPLVIQSATHSHFDLFFPKRPTSLYNLRTLRHVISPDYGPGQFQANINLSNPNLDRSKSATVQMLRCTLGERASLRLQIMRILITIESPGTKIPSTRSTLGNLFVVCLFVFISADVL